MKKITIILSVLIAMTIKANAQIPNSGFETWVDYVDSGDCNTPHLVYQTPDMWKGSLGKNCLVYSYSIQKNNESYPAGTGQFSMKIQPDTADGVRGVASTVHKNSSMANGIPPSFAINYKPTSLYLYYKCSSFGGDTIMCMVYFYKNKVVIGSGVFGTTATVPAWTPLEIPIIYTTLDVPDSATVFFMTGVYIQHSTVSTLYVDNLSFAGFVSSVPEKISENTIFNLYPNPVSATTQLTIEASSLTKECILIISNINGQELIKQKIEDAKTKIDINNLAKGIYFVKLIADKTVEVRKVIIE